MTPVLLPRSLVVKLLHQAQLGEGAGLILRRPDGVLTIEGIRSGSAPAELEGRTETVFAFYCTAAQTEPDAADVRRWSEHTRLFFSISVGTKGVLQLRGWQAAGGRLDPMELSLAEEDAAQSSGVSR